MRLLGIECARGLAALAVVLFHAMAGMNFMFGTNDPTGLIRYGEHGVDFFFVLSGFIIAYVHGKDVGDSQRFRSYALKRAIRLFPLIWVVAIPWSLLRAVNGEWPASVDVVLTSLFLVPSTEDPVPIVLWTLRHEVFFYAAFGFLILWRPVAVWLIAIWTALCVGQLVLAVLGRPVNGLPGFFLSSFNLQFLLGAGIAYLHQRVDFRKSPWPLVFGVALVTLALGSEGRFGLNRSGLSDYVSFGATAWVLALGLSFAALLHGILCLPTFGSPPRLLVLLGSASFAIYLIHVPVITVLQRATLLLPDLVAISGGYALLVLGSVAGGILLHLLVERPITSVLRGIFLRPPETIPSASRTAYHWP